MDGTSDRAAGSWNLVRREQRPRAALGGRAVKPVHRCPTEQNELASVPVSRAFAGIASAARKKASKQGSSPQTRRLEGAEGLCPFSPPNRSSAQLPPPTPSGSGSVQPGPREACFPPPSPPLTRLREAADAASQQLRKGIPAWPDLPKTHDFEPP